jgi:aconitate decarboxylase
MDAIAAFADHVVNARAEDLPAAAVAAAKVFILDTLGVGLAGSSGPMARELADVQEASGRGEEARVWGQGRRLPAAAAAMCNAYQVHNSEFDCLHEQAVVHAMTVVLPVAMAGAERRRAVAGRDLIAAVIVGVDVAAGLGIAARTGLRFFRPGTAGAFGGAAALGRLMGLDHAAMINAFSLAYGQVCGTMQAHAEGSMLLALQMGFNARNAVVACDLAARGFDAPKGVLEGAFGYFKLIEAGGSPESVVQGLGRRWLVTELAHKPYPTGRATHGIIEACLTLRRQHALQVSDIAHVTARVPPLVHHLVGRPPAEHMSITYARLCAPYLAAYALRMGDIGQEAFTAQAYGDAATQALARRVAIEVRDAGDPNALTPIAVEIHLADGSCHATSLEIVGGNPAKPLSRDEHLAKFRRNCRSAARPLDPQVVERLIDRVERLEEVADVAELADF